MKQIQLIEITPDELKELILTGINKEIEKIKVHFKPINQVDYLTRNEVANLLKIHISSVHNWTKKGILIAYQMGGRVYYRRTDIDEAFEELK